MIRFEKGNLLTASSEALVNTVNEVGVMGKGIALMFRERFPVPSREYERAAKAGQVRVGQMLVTQNGDGEGNPRWIIHFPTKRHWRHKSKVEWIVSGLGDLIRVIREYKIRSIALPPLGCGAGGLDWHVVRQVIEDAAAELPTVEFLVFEPTSNYQNEPKSEGVERLTPARALIAEIVRRYSVLGLDCTNLEVQKLAWFLTRSISALKLEDPLNLEFEANVYGPYADRLRHLLNALDGSYLHCSKRISDAGPFDLIWFVPSKRSRVEEFLRRDAERYVPPLELASEVIDGFESPLGMELLATVDWLMNEEGVRPTVPALRAALTRWPGGEHAAVRKVKLFDERLISVAIERLLKMPGFAPTTVV
jgi:O-acetyl-ADP-ribose deacetylase (regulator of RNase III)